MTYRKVGIIAAKDGIAALSLNAVAKQAGGSKRVLLHNFLGRQELIHTLFIRLLAVMDSGIMALMAVDDNPRGRFSRAYLMYLAGISETDTSR